MHENQDKSQIFNVSAIHIWFTQLVNENQFAFWSLLISWINWSSWIYFIIISQKLTHWIVHRASSALAFVIIKLDFKQFLINQRFSHIIAITWILIPMYRLQLCWKARNVLPIPLYLIIFCSSFSTPCIFCGILHTICEMKTPKKHFNKSDKGIAAFTNAYNRLKVWKIEEKNLNIVVLLVLLLLSPRTSCDNFAGVIF